MGFEHVRAGDVVARVLGQGGPEMELRVTAVDARLVHCGAWTFDRATGAEVDEELGWGPEGTGSYLVRVLPRGEFGDGD